MIKIYYVSQSIKKIHLPDNFHHISINEILENVPEDGEAYAVSTPTPWQAYKVLSAIRKSPIKKTYLSPVYFITYSEQKNVTDSNSGMFDSIFFSPGLTDYIAYKIYENSAPLVKRIRELPESTDINISLKILKFMQVRDKHILPEMTAENLYGYIYSSIKIFFNKDDSGFYQILEFLESNHLIAGKFYDIAHFCSNCGSAFLNFREICPECSSPNIKTEDLIHHFKCAHVGPETEFIQEDLMVCPKCKDTLRHIGVDFDKPSIIFTCRECGSIFQEPDTDSKCYNCQITNYPENQDKKIIKEYSITSLGQNACVHGLDSLFQSVIKEDLPLIPYKVFKTILEAESERIKRYSLSQSTIAYFEITNIETIYSKLGKNSKSFFSELSRVIKSMLRISDFITSVNESVFLSMLPETDLKGAYTALHRLENQIQKLLKSNTDQKITINTKAIAIDGETKGAEIINELLQNE